LSDTTSDAPPASTTPRQLVRTPIALGIGAVFSVLLVAAGLIALLGGTAPAKSSLPTKPLPEFSLPKVTGRGRLVMPWSEGHPTVVLFFAKWCTICHREVPMLARVIGRGDLGPVRVVGIDEDAQLGVAQAFVRSSGVRFPVGLDSLEMWAAEFVPAGLPAAIFVRANGKEADLQYGALTVMQLSAGLSKLVHA
jgi:thiol-disulfide isomerase/thioredoxin